MTKNKTFLIETYGCQMNVAQSSQVKQQLINAGYMECNNFSNQTGIVLINTCSVRHSAENRVYGRLGHYKKLKEDNNFILIIIGCMAENEKISLKQSYPFIDYIVGTHYSDIIPELVKGKIENNIITGFDRFVFTPSTMDEKYLFRAYVNIIHGCSNFCSYCIVPYVRGKEISRKPDEIINDIKNLVERGVKEFILLGQNVNSYGIDSGFISFGELLIQIDKIKGVQRLKFITSHPKDFSFELIDILSELETLCHDIHLPLQSGSDKVLSLMNRKYTFADYAGKIDYLRKKIKNPKITTDLLVGFPGEGRDEYNETLNAVSNIRYDNAYMYKYSPRKGTKAYEIMEEITADEKQDRLSRLIQLQNKITLEKCREQVNNIESVLIESVSKNEKQLFRGLTQRGNPVVFSPKNSFIGDIVNVLITDVSGQTLRGEMV